MNQAEKEIIEAFCRELALALRRITGKNIEIRPDELAATTAPQAQPNGSDTTSSDSKPNLDQIQKP